MRIMKSNEGGEGLAGENKAPTKMVKLSPNHVTGRVDSSTWWIGPKVGSVIPVRRSVKRLMLDWVLQLLGFSSASAAQKASNGGCEMAQLPKVAGGEMIGKQVSPSPPELGTVFD